MVILAALGMFVFTTRSIPFQGMDRSQEWRHPNQTVVGDYPPSQYTGKEAEQITISAELRPEVTGGAYSVKELREMADTGEPHTLILGTGEILGSYVITSIAEKSSELEQDGSARAISLSLGLKKVSDTAVGLQDKNLLLAAGMVRKIVGV